MSIKSLKQDNDLIISNLSIKAKEAEDLPMLNSGAKKPQKSEQEELSDRTAEIWNCIARKQNKLGGYIYTFKMKDEYSDIQALNETYDTIYPAVEPKSIDKINFDSIHLKLGYSVDPKNECFSLPDREAIISNWEKLRETCTELPSLDILTSGGIASDLEFFETFITRDALLSSGKEFVHDSIFHIVPTLTQMKELQGDYKKERARVVKMLTPIYRTLMIAKRKLEKNGATLKENLLEKMNLMLGFVTDTIANQNDTTLLGEDFPLKWIKSRWDNPPEIVQNFFKRRIGSEKLSNTPFSTVWEQIKQIGTDIPSMQEI